MPELQRQLQQQLRRQLHHDFYHRFDTQLVQQLRELDKVEPLVGVGVVSCEDGRRLRLVDVDEAEVTQRRLQLAPVNVARRVAVVVVEDAPRGVHQLQVKLLRHARPAAAKAGWLAVGGDWNTRDGLQIGGVLTRAGKGRRRRGAP